MSDDRTLDASPSDWLRGHDAETRLILAELGQYAGVATLQWLEALAAIDDDPDHALTSIVEMEITLEHFLRDSVIEVLETTRGAIARINARYPALDSAGDEEMSLPLTPESLPVFLGHLVELKLGITQTHAAGLMRMVERLGLHEERDLRVDLSGREGRAALVLRVFRADPTRVDLALYGPADVIVLIRGMIEGGGEP